MEKLPIEIVDQILRHAPPDWPLSRLATVSKLFQQVIERRTFDSLSVHSDEIRLLQARLDAYPHRIGALQKLVFQIRLPPYPEQAYRKYEQEDDRRKNNASFSEAILEWFAFLSSVGHFRRQIDMMIPGPYSPSDFFSLDSGQRLKRFNVARKHVEDPWFQDLFEQRNKHSFLDLTLPHADLPKLSRVRLFQMEVRTSPRVAAQISSRLPDLQTVIWHLSDDVLRFPALRRRLRREFALALRELSLPALEAFTLHYPAPALVDQEHTTPDLMELGEDTPRLGYQLGRFLHSHNLVHIHLGGPICVDESLFSTLLSAAEDVTWHNLRVFEFLISPIAPDGTWYFDREPSGALAQFEAYVHIEDDPGYEFDQADDAEEVHDPYELYDSRMDNDILGTGRRRIFRFWPTKGLERILQTAAHALSRMPHIQRFLVASPLLVANGLLRRFALQCTLSIDQNIHEIECTVPTGWRMSPELQEVWEKAILLGDEPIKYLEWKLPSEENGDDSPWSTYNSPPPGHCISTSRVHR